jgi:hypothetical protein
MKPWATKNAQRSNPSSAKQTDWLCDEKWVVQHKQQAIKRDFKNPT